MEKVYLVFYGWGGDLLEVYSSKEVAEARAKQVENGYVVERKVLDEC